MNGLLHSTILDHIGDWGDSVAIRTAGASITYEELDRRSNHIACRLAAMGVGAGDLVAVCVPRDANMPATLLAVLRAGAAYLPIDPHDPSGRRELVLSDSGAALFIAAGELNAGDHSCPTLDIDELDGPGPYADPSPAEPDDLAYVIYTSGSTGTPKGVEVQHKSVAALFESMDAHVEGTAGDVWLSVTSPAFDISVFELFWPLGRGMTVEIADTAGARLFDTALSRADHDITHMQATPTLLTGLLLDADSRDGLGRLRHLTSTGEALPVALAQELRSIVPGTLLNAYGPTETTIWSAVEHLRTPIGDPLSIGQALEGQVITVRDSTLEILSDGEVGELCISGSGLAAGYRGHPDLPADPFVTDPNAPVGGGRLYRTGDLGYRLADGRFVCLGRTDRQVKLRGHRIELDEVEHAVQALDQVDSGAVVVVGEGATAKLVAFVVAKDRDTARMRAELADRLAAASVPAEIRFLDAMPMTTSGKVDRKLLG